MTTIDKIRDLMDEGLSAEKIAKKVGCKVNTVRTYKYKIRKEEEPIEPKTTTKKSSSPEDSSSEKIKELKQKIKELDQININHLGMLKQQREKYEEIERNYELAKASNGKTSDELDQLKKDYSELQHDYNRLSETRNSDFSASNIKIECFQETINELGNKVKDLNKRNEELRYEAEQVIDDFEQKYKVESIKHDLLFKYLVTTKEAVQV